MGALIIKFKQGTVKMGEAVWEPGIEGYRIITPCENWLGKSGLKDVVGDVVTWETSTGVQLQLTVNKYPFQGHNKVRQDLRYPPEHYIANGASISTGLYDGTGLGSKAFTTVFGLYKVANRDGRLSVVGPQYNINGGLFDNSKNVVGGAFHGTPTGEDFQTFLDMLGGDIKPDNGFPGPDNEDDPEGGDGEGPDGLEDDPIEVPEDPSISAVASGLLTLYTPTLGQIHAFGNFLWSDLFSLDTFKKLFADPMQAVIGLSALPISVPSSGAQNIIIGSVDSGVSANRAAKQFVRKDCGTIHIKPTWNTALDYEPYTKFSIFLPYIGTRELKTDDIMNKDINVSYLIDILSGSCTAHINVGGSVLYQFSGSCAVPIPVTGTSWNNLLTSCIQLAGAGIVTAASGGAASAAVAGAMAASSTANMVANAKPNIQRTGAVSGAAGMLGVQTPYLIRETPRQSLAKGYNKFVGYPSNITSKLGDLKGYTQVENIHLENLACTADEAAEIESLLKEGVII